MITKQDLISASKQKRMHIARDFLPNHFSWSDIDSMYELDNDVIYYSFGTFQLQDMEIISDWYKDLLDSIYKIHNGDLLFGMTIVHLVTNNKNTSNDTDFLSLRNKIYQENPIKIPEGVAVKDYGLHGDTWHPKVHADAQERFYIQGNGQTLWRLFDDSKNLTNAVILNPGDMAYIPHGLFHSVESVGPRHSFSLALSEDPEISQS
jgi:mannose-6-phosphate isomerase-like protein (cupin superfamily)